MKRQPFSTIESVIVREQLTQTVALFLIIRGVIGLTYSPLDLASAKKTVSQSPYYKHSLKQVGISSRVTN